MIMTAMLTDQIGRRPLTVYPYAVTTLSVLCLGIIGCFDYTQKSTSSLLVSHLKSIVCDKIPDQYRTTGLFRLSRYILDHRCLINWLRIRCRNSPATPARSNGRLIACGVQFDCAHVQLLHAPDDQRTPHQMGCQDRILVRTQFSHK